MGDFRNGGRELRAKGDPEDVQGHDVVDEELGRTTPYGVYDLAQNEAWVSVGIRHDTGEFAVQSVRTWWKEMGEPRYPLARSLVITADRGGGNGYRREWNCTIHPAKAAA